MTKNIEFREQKSGLGLSVASIHLTVMVDYMIKSGVNETGGILVGYYTEDLKYAVICMVTGPPTDSKFGPYWFQRGNRGLKKILETASQENQYYLGEWHYHPKGIANPSDQDLIQMSKIANKRDYYCPEPIMIIIAGTPLEYTFSAFITNRVTNTTVAFIRS